MPQLIHHPYGWCIIVATMLTAERRQTAMLVLYWISVGVMMGVGFLHAALWWSSILGLALMLRLLRTASYSYTKTFFLGVLAGTAKTCLVIFWFWSAYPLDWIGVSDRTLQFITVFTVWFTVSLSIGLGLGFFCLAVRSVLQKGRAISLLVVPVTLVLSEMLGSLFFSVYSLGPQSTPNVHFSFGYFGYTFAGHGVFSLAAFVGGVYALSLLAGFIAVVLADSVLSRKKAIIIFGIVVVSYFIPQSYLTSVPSTTVSAVNTAFPIQQTMTEREREVRSSVLAEAFTAALATKSDVVVFPEAANGLGSFATTSDVLEFVSAAGDTRPIVVDSEEVVDEVTGSHVVAASIYDTSVGKMYTAYKNYLVPSGEFLPYNMVRAMRLLGFTEVVAVLEQKMRLASNHSRAVESLPSTLPGVLFCSESVSPLGTTKATRGDDVPLIVHPVSHAWFHSPESLWYQLDLMLRAQVRFARVPLVQAGNMTPARAYNRNGLPVGGRPVFVNDNAVVVWYEL